MKRVFKYIFVMLLFIPFCRVKAASSYSVEMVSSSSANRVIGTYSSYNEAVNVMNSQNSTETSVATIYKDGVPVDSKYAIFKFKPSGSSLYYLYRNSNSSSSFTYMNSSYGIDAALLGYSDNGRVKIMISGFTGWTDINNGVVTPISLLGGNMININGSGVNLRSDHSTSSSVVASISGSFNFNYTETYKGSDYTWYKISYNGVTCWAAGGYWLTPYNSSLGTYYKHYGPSGNLIHHFTTYGGVNYEDSFTNLGTAPSYMTKDVWYYSFDGNYFYANLTSMLDDYRSGSYGRSINSNNPHYSYYIYLPSHSTTGYTAADFDSVIASKYNASQSKMYGTGAYFKEAEELYGTNALLAFSAALNESNWGTSSIAMNKNNLFGYGAADSCPYDCAYSYNSPRDSIMDYASKSSTSYETPSGKYYNGSHYGNKSSGKNINYASDPYWGEVMASNAFNRDKSFGGKDFNSNTIGVTKKGISGVVVYKNPNTSTALYTMKNPKSNDPVYDFSVNIIDKVTDNGQEYYKIYTDLAAGNDRFGYVLASSFYVSNTQPTITVSDKTISVGDAFDYLEGVSASDKENGNLTSKITYSGTVDTNKEGSYQVTYTVSDNNNFHVSKTVTIKVIGDDSPVIEATDKEVLQFDQFDYLDGVSANDSHGDLTSSISYSGTVDMNTPGIYSITYSVTGSTGKTSTKTIKITVIKNEAPSIEAYDKTVILGNEVDLLDGVSAFDKEDGDLTNKISIQDSTVDFNTIGEYSVTYKVSDKHGQVVTKTIVVNIKEKTLVEKNGWFHLENLSFVADKLEIKGFNVVSGVNNGKTVSVKHKLLLEQQDGNNCYSFDLNRWIEQTPFTPNDGSKNDYSGSWFSGQINLTEILQGDYTLYIYTETADYFTKQIVSNIEYTNSIMRTYKGSGNRGYLIKENPVLSTVDLELFVRDNGLITYDTAPVRGIMINDFFDYEFLDNKLYITGSSYALKTDYNGNIEREIILEDVVTKEIVYRKDAQLINGPYKIESVSRNDLTKAWFKAEVDLANLEKSTYVIYIRTKTGNVNGYGELVDYAYSDLSSKAEINNKQVKLQRNNDMRVRLELKVY